MAHFKFPKAIFLAHESINWVLKYLGPSFLIEALLVFNQLKFDLYPHQEGTTTQKWSFFWRISIKRSTKWVQYFLCNFKQIVSTSCEFCKLRECSFKNIKVFLKAASSCQLLFFAKFLMANIFWVEEFIAEAIFGKIGRRMYCKSCNFLLTQFPYFLFDGVEQHSRRNVM